MSKQPPRKVVYNACYGGFSLSAEGVRLARELSGDPNWGGSTTIGDICQYTAKPLTSHDGFILDIARHDPILVKVVEALGHRANGESAILRIINVGYDSYKITAFDGSEEVSVQSGWL